ncbi:IS1634 family transposase, partial [Vibrio vulnificus]
TNDTDNEALTMAALLAHYKSQQKVERGFRFLKSPEFLTSSIFLKKPERIEAFFPSMVKNKTTSRPTARWVFLQFEGIDT